MLMRGVCFLEKPPPIIVMLCRYCSYCSNINIYRYYLEEYYRVLLLLPTLPTFPTSSTFHQTLETAPKAVSISERLMSLLIIEPRMFEAF